MVKAREAWHAAVLGVAKSQTRLSDWRPIKLLKDSKSMTAPGFWKSADQWLSPASPSWMSANQCYPTHTSAWTLANQWQPHISRTVSNQQVLLSGEPCFCKSAGPWWPYSSDHRVTPESLAVPKLYRFWMFTNAWIPKLTKMLNLV